MEEIKTNKVNNILIIVAIFIVITCFMVIVNGRIDDKIDRIEAKLDSLTKPSK